ncbi:hypothetical protein CM15mP35_05790 [bacterium]|nr:MAG: hypothetical protein CM15mP35_05790 [bacterium]
MFWGGKILNEKLISFKFNKLLLSLTKGKFFRRFSTFFKKKNEGIIFFDKNIKWSNYKKKITQTSRSFAYHPKNFFFFPVLFYVSKYCFQICLKKFLHH